MVTSERRKWFALGLSAFCVAVLLGMGVWAAVGIQHEKEKTSRGQRKFQFQVEARDKDGKVFQVVMKDGGFSNIAGARDLNDFANRVKENMTVIRDKTNDAATNYSMEFKFGTPKN